MVAEDNVCEGWVLQGKPVSSSICWRSLSNHAPSHDGSHVHCRLPVTSYTALTLHSTARQVEPEAPVHSCCTGHDMTLDVTAEQTASQYTTAAAAADDDDGGGDVMMKCPKHQLQ